MKYLVSVIFLVSFLLCPNAAKAQAGSIVQTCNNGIKSTSSSSIPCTFGVPVTAGNFIIGETSCDNSGSGKTLTSLSDGSTSNTYTSQISTSITPGPVVQFTAFTAPVTKANTILTATYSGVCSLGMTIIAREYSGLPTNPVDQVPTVATGASGTTFTSGTTGTTAQANEILVGVGYMDNGGGSTLVVGSGYGNAVFEQDEYYWTGIEDKKVTSTGAYTATFTNSGSVSGWIMGIITLKENSGSPQAATPVITPSSGALTVTPGQITMSDITPGATIYYTVDGSTPTCSSTTYSSYFYQAIPSTVKAIACASGYSASPVVTDSYTFTAGLYNARSDLVADAEVLPSLCSPAPCTMHSSDLNYNVPIVRVTDTNTLTAAGYPGNSYSTTNSIDNMWSLDMSSFLVLNDNGSLVPFTLNTSTLAVAPIHCTNGSDPNCLSPGANGLVNLNYVDASYSKVTPNLIFVDSSTAIVSIDLRPTISNAATSTTTSTIATIGSCPGIASSTATGLMTGSSADQRLSLPAGSGQDSFYLVYVWDKTQGCRWLNTSTMTVGGSWGPTGAITYHDENGNPITTVTYSDAHGSQIDPTGRWATVDSETTNANFQDFWDIATLNLYQCGVGIGGSGTCTGHGVWGYSNDMFFLTDNSVSLMNEHTFPPALPSTNLYANSTPPQPVGFGDYAADSHTNWNNNPGNNSTPMIINPVCTLDEDPSCPPPTVGWIDELIGVYSNGTSQVYRFVHTYSSDTLYYSLGLPQVSSDGKFVMWGSDWQGSGRIDLFLSPLPLSSASSAGATISGVKLSGGATQSN